MCVLSHEFNSRCVHSHEFDSRCVHSHPCAHARPFVFRASAVRRSDLRVSCVTVGARVRCGLPSKSPFNTIPNQSQFHCFSRPCASFRTSSILVACIRTSSILVKSIRILASMRILSCSVRLRFGAVTCVSHVLRCARAGGAVFGVPFAI